MPGEPCLWFPCISQVAFGGLGAMGFYLHLTRAHSARSRMGQDSDHLKSIAIWMLTDFCFSAWSLVSIEPSWKCLLVILYNCIVLKMKGGKEFTPLLMLLPWGWAEQSGNYCLPTLTPNGSQIFKAHLYLSSGRNGKLIISESRIVHVYFVI